MLVTENLGAAFLRRHDDLPLGIEYIINPVPKGFGENHNAAFARAEGQYFCVMNPDIRLKGNPLNALVCATWHKPKGVAGPRVVSPTGTLEDSARRVPRQSQGLLRGTSSGCGTLITPPKAPRAWIGWQGCA
ncbi:glycosyltransferase [Cupriavidus basilensis]